LGRAGEGVFYALRANPNTAFSVALHEKLGALREEPFNPPALLSR
jgi:hypothetical protein